MSYNQDTGKSRQGSRMSIVPLVLIAIGLILIIGQFASNITSYIQPLFVHVDHPLHFDFSKYNQLLQECVKGDLVDYRKLSSDPALNQAVDQLTKVSPDKIVDNHEQLSFWINAYNLLILKTIADRYPIQNTNQIANQLSLHKFIVGGQPYSVSEIEATKLPPLLAEANPLAIFLVCGGSIGYPPLLNQAIDYRTLDETAKNATAKFVNNPKNVLLNADTQIFSLSPFFKWHENLFEKTSGSAFEFVNTFLVPERQVNLKSIRLRQTFMPSFDTHLNDTANGDKHD